ncbi:hypothetical protein NQ317_001453 [Molorchus minor]|uniref:CUB domain-containing protein n=1 Tax=Molorchus minor TaxID=1323400 RepID=A0ABQ9JP16_9CUCU|nr:hypothetical protein NQ317_001453 [Molorchus minor]
MFRALLRVTLLCNLINVVHRKIGKPVSDENNMKCDRYRVFYLSKMKSVISIIVLFALFSYVSSQSTTELTTKIDTTTSEPTTTSIPIIFLTDDAIEFFWTPHSPQTVIIEADEGYKITVNITECDIDGANGEYATISSDELIKGLTFTYELNKQPAYLFNSNRLVGSFFGTNASNFTAIFTRTGECFNVFLMFLYGISPSIFSTGEPATTTTTEIPTTTIFLPTPNENDSSTLLVYLEGRSLSEFADEDILQQLKDAIFAMAVEYCDNENFPLNGSITSDNVVIHKLSLCPLNWPDFDICTELIFALPVNLMEDANSLWSGYQLTTNHLEIMWSRYASKYLPNDITYYFSLDTGSLKWGIVIATVVLVGFIICMALMRYCGARVSKAMRRRKLSDTTSIISTNDRNSQTSLPPHYLQETPPLFENAYPMYNPDKNTVFSDPPYSKPLEYEDYQDVTTDIEKKLDEDDEESRA